MPSSKTAAQLSGILAMNKPIGWTSHDVVARVRRLTGIKRVGHAGTLDPAAEGVLLVCLGAATRVSEYLMAGIKRYRAVIRLGATSATDDSEGPLTPGSPPDALDRATIDNALRRYVGDVEQVPPRFAAIKVGGRALYERARAGEEFVPERRLVHIDAIHLVAWDAPDVTIDVTCSKGTYIRSLARDLGQALGTGGYLLALTRTASGEFRLEETVTLDDVAAAIARGQFSSLLLPIDRAVAAWPALTLTAADATRVVQGQRCLDADPTLGDRARAYDHRGHFIALLQRDVAANAWQPIKVFDREDVDGAA